METTKKVKKHHFFGKTFSLITCLIAFGLMITMADLFSSLITVGGFSFTSENISLGEYNVYAVCTSSHQTKVLAIEFSEIIRNQGGAGYLYMNKDSYYIVASIYETEADAKKVLEKLVESKPDAQIEKIVIQPITISSNLSSQEKSTVSASINLFKNIYKKLYDISVSLDTAVVSEVNARLSINEVLSSAQTILSNFNTLFSNNITINLLKLKLSIEDTVKDLNSLVNSSSVFPFTSLVKECYCKVIMNYKNLADQMN